jgi:arylsulfatase A
MSGLDVDAALSLRFKEAKLPSRILRRRRGRRTKASRQHSASALAQFALLAIMSGCDAGDRSTPATMVVPSASTVPTHEFDRGDRPPNVVLIIADDLGVGSVGSYGQELIATPRLDALAAEGMRFASFHSGGDACSSSRATLLTGLHTGHAYIRGNFDLPDGGQLPLPAGTVTLARLLQDAGYETAMIGKWGLGDAGSEGEPSRQGFDYTFGYLNQVLAHNSYPEFLWRNGERVPLRNVATYVDVKPEFGGLASYSTVKTDFAADLITAEAESFIEQNAARPFFLYLAYTAPHTNGDAPVGQRVEVPSYSGYEDRLWPDEYKAYAALVTRLDSDVGRILDRLEKLGLEDETLVVFTSDNGAPAIPLTHFFDANGGLRGGKFSLYEGGLVVPLIVRWPGHVVAGGQSGQPAALWDLFPTIAEAAGVANLPAIDGVSLLPTLFGSTPPQRSQPLYWESQTRGGTIVVHDGRWKGLYFGEHNLFELFDVESDPLEITDRSAENPAVVAALLESMRASHTSSELFPVLPTERSYRHQIRRLAKAIYRRTWSPDLWPEAPE